MISSIYTNKIDTDQFQVNIFVLLRKNTHDVIAGVFHIDNINIQKIPEPNRQRKDRVFFIIKEVLSVTPVQRQISPSLFPLHPGLCHTYSFWQRNIWWIIKILKEIIISISHRLKIFKHCRYRKLAEKILTALSTCFQSFVNLNNDLVENFYHNITKDLMSKVTVIVEV